MKIGSPPWSGDAGCSFDQRLPSIVSFGELFERAAEIADSGPEEIEQDDTFFLCTGARLKLRTFSATSGELIFYRRPNESGPKESFYVITPTTDPTGLRELLTLAYGQAGRVIKVRTLFMVGRTRIHLDKVQGLGNFMELEVVLAEQESSASGMDEAEQIMEKLGIKQSQLVTGAYVDLLFPPAA